MERPISKPRITTLLPVLVLLSFAVTARPAAAARWQVIGPDDDGTVRTLAFAPSRPSYVYAGTFGGVSRSTDGGRTWTEASAGLGDLSIAELVVSPDDHRRVWAATGDGLYRSVDAGHTWIHVFTQPVLAIALDPRHPSVVYIGTRDRMFRSGNYGATWLPMGESLLPFETRFLVPDLVVAPSWPQILYAAHYGHRSGVFKSGNRGQGWSRILWGVVSHLAVDPRHARTLWAVDQWGVLRTTDAGATWTRVLEAFSLGTIVFSPTGDRIYLAGWGQVLMSRDGGAHWEGLDNGLPFSGVSSLAVDPANPDRLLAGLAGLGVFVLDPAIGLWQRSSDGLVGFAAESVAPAPDGSVLVGTFFGLYQTTDEGESWTRLLPEIFFQTLAVAPSDPGILYAAGRRPYGGLRAHLYRRDGSGPWRLVSRELRPSILSLAVHPANPDIVYAGTPQGLFRTTDGGGTWTRLLAAEVRSVAIDPDDPTRVYATQGRNLYVSRDSGAHWHLLLFGSTPGLHSRRLDGVAVAPSDPRWMAAIDWRQIFISSDGGATWQAVPRPPQMSRLRTVTFAPGNERILLAGGEGGAALSTDGGATWQPLGAGISGHDVTALVYDPSDPGRLYAATRTAGAMLLDPAP